MTALRRVAPLPLLLILGVLAVLVLASSDTAQAQEPPAQQGETSGYNGPAPTPAQEYRVPVNWPLIPKDANGNNLVGPGGSFRLMFLTSTKRNAESGNIADYVTFVTGRAAAGHASIRPYSADFRPVISTDGPSNIHATTVISYVTDPNVPADAPGRVPVYWLNGAKVADNSQDFFDNSWDSHAARSESGTAYTVNNTTLHDLRAWTGSTHWGGRNYSAGNPNPRTGILRAGDEIEYDQRPRDKHHRLYAMSPVFTVDRTRARATFGVSERFGNWRGCGGDVYYNPYYLSGPSVVYRGNTYDYEFTHHARRKPSGSAGCDSWGATIRAVIGLVSGTGTVSSYHQGSDDDAAWLNRRWNNVHPGEEGHPAEFTVSQADDSTLVGRESTCYETERRHPTETHDMSVSIPANAPRGSTFKVAFFRWSGTRCDGTKVDTRSGLGDRGWSAGALDENQVELGTVGTVTVAPVPDAADQPTIAWGPTRNSVRIEFEANDHDGSDFIVNYNVHLRRLQSNGTWTKWGGVGRVNHREGATLSTVVSGLQPSTRYQVRVSPRAQMWSGGQVYYGPNGPAVEFATHTELAPDPPTGLRAQQVYYNRAEVRWNAPGHVGVAPIARYTISARQQIGAGWSDWGWSANAAPGARSHTVTGYCSARGQSHCPAGSFVEFDPQRTYQIRVSARNQQGNTPRDSAQSEIVEIQTIAVLTNAPGGPRVSQLTHNSVRVSWDAPTNDGAERIHNWGIDVRRLKPDNTWTDWSRVNAGANARTIVRTGLEPDSDYQVRVFPRARMRPGGRDHYGPATDSLDFRTRTEVPSAPDAPTALQPADAAPAHRRELDRAGLGGGVGGQRLLAARAGGERMEGVAPRGHGDGHHPDVDGLAGLRPINRARPGAGHRVPGAGGGGEPAGSGAVLGHLLLRGDPARGAQRTGRAHGVADRLRQREGDLERAGPLHGGDAHHPVRPAGLRRQRLARVQTSGHAIHHPDHQRIRARRRRRQQGPGAQHRLPGAGAGQEQYPGRRRQPDRHAAGRLVGGDRLPHRAGDAHRPHRHPPGRRGAPAVDTSQRRRPRRRHPLLD